jgi:hypothetical protein
MGWLANRALCGACNRSSRRLATEFGVGAKSGTLAIALGHACYPTAIYGDKALHDQIIEKLKQFEPRPCSAADACRHVENWLDKGIISTEDVFRNVWGLDPQEFIARFVATFDCQRS